MRVLVAEDDKVMSQLICATLMGAGHQAIPAFDGASTMMAAMRTPPPDVIVLDLQMPGMNSLDLQRYLKMVYPGLRLPVVMITAHDNPGSCERCLAAGAAAYMRKPVKGAALINEIRKLTSCIRRTSPHRLGISGVAFTARAS